MEEEKITPVALVMCKTIEAVTNDVLHVAPVYGSLMEMMLFHILMIWRRPSKNTSGMTAKSST